MRIRWLVNLASNVQEALLLSVESVRDPIKESEVRRVARVMDWVCAAVLIRKNGEMALIRVRDTARLNFLILTLITTWKDPFDESVGGSASIVSVNDDKWKQRNIGKNVFEFARVTKKVPVDIGK